MYHIIIVEIADRHFNNLIRKEENTMALIKCPDCGKEFSDLAPACPNCGRPNQVQPQRPTGSAMANRANTPGPTVVQNNNGIPQSTKKKGSGCLIALLAFIFIPFVIGLIVSSAKKGVGKTDNVTPSQLDANTENTETLSSSLTKDEAKDIDTKIWDYVYPIITAHNNLLEVMAGYSDGSISELDFYNATKDFRDYVQETWGNPPSVSDENGKSYLESCKDYIIVEQTMAESLLKYIDSKKTSDLSKVEENIERCTQAVQIVASNRGTFLGINDFSDDEIQQIVDETMN